MNATDAQVSNMSRAAPPPASSTAQPSSTMESQSSVGPSNDAQNQMIQKFSQQSGMTFDFSKLLVFLCHCWSIVFFHSSCLLQNGWNYDNAAQNFQDLLKTVCLLFFYRWHPLVFSSISEFDSTWSFQENINWPHHRLRHSFAIHIFLYLLVCALLFFLSSFQQAK